MVENARTLLLWVTAIVLLLASACSLNIATYNYFGADFPGPYRHAWVTRGNMFALLAFVLFAAFLYVSIVIGQRIKRWRAKD